MNTLHCLKSAHVPIASQHSRPSHRASRRSAARRGRSAADGRAARREPADVGRSGQPRAGGRSDGPAAAAEERERRTGARRSAHASARSPSSGRWRKRRPGCASSSKGITRARAEFLHLERGTLRAALIKPLPEAVGTIDRSRSTTSAACRSSSTARCRSPPASRPTSRRSIASLDDPLRIAYLLASLLDMKAEDKQKLLEEDNLDRQARRRRDGADARNRSARAEGTDPVARPRKR